ncbi:putative NADH-ubiquinone oxidoreductase subunit GRIM-19 [Aspergillus homomorphus CBS 101889]|uniref:NADH dehydrogenase [ubiquinone] 1 alpha subcomplex subunit 13 n=1 Tax=Aspergillus homomorphus (strain CBS 101889) TaxID=1450537 RepID=A0A395HTU2_ASPHC|nr:NADH-ubiquinone oxidoreductase subunit GRIM-19 [Aspergillus homomorphus CBS 101889]RAL10805.1 NADH-ubiquinone oxidoreductase subunit GRIM-19 [Aspergillus homomorphus CBS 101889]
MPQDMPPAGGYHQVQYKRNIPVRGFRPIVYVAGMVGCVAYGLYKQYYAAREQYEIGREKMWARLHILPLLQAEEDRDQVRRYYADKAREQSLLGAEIKVYNSDRFVRPTFAYTPAKVTE